MGKTADIMKYEIEGISKTICDYSTNNFILSYANQLKALVYPQDIEGITYLVNKLSYWYETEIEIISNNDYVFGKDAHYKSFEKLKQLKITIDALKGTKERK